MDRPKVIKDKACLEYIEHLEAQLKTPYAEAFLSLKRMVDKGNSQLKTTDFDVFTPDGESKFKQAAKFTSQLKDWYTEMEYFKSKMSPQEINALKTEEISSPVERQKALMNQSDSK